MKSNEVIAVVLRLLALYLFFQFLLELPQTLRAMSSIGQGRSVMDDGGMMLSMLRLHLAIVFLAYVPASVLLFFKADRLARLFVKGGDKEVETPGDVSDGIRACVFRCAGVYALIVWGPEFVQVLCRTIIYGTWQSDQIPVLQRFYENWSALISPAVGVSIGMWLAFSQRGFMRFIRHM